MPSTRPAPEPATRAVQTRAGPARVTVDGPGRAAGLLVLGHGAGGGIEAADLLAARDGAVAAGWRVVRVEQPWRVAGRRVAAPPAALDAAWLEVVSAVARRRPGGRLVLGGRSAGARVACRTAGALGAEGVVALAFPLRPPGGGPDRAGELAAAGVPVLVVQGERDAFGVPDRAPGRAVVPVPGADHGFAVRRRDPLTGEQVLAAVAETVAGWLQALT